ncbi:MAG: hypothetical protein VX397_03305 [Pseudomonadota bacterium]|nr:hypothetical protein [Pseudomonadota bacterium]
MPKSRVSRFFFIIFFCGIYFSSHTLFAECVSLNSKRQSCLMDWALKILREIQAPEQIIIPSIEIAKAYSIIKEKKKSDDILERAYKFSQKIDKNETRLTFYSEIINSYEINKFNQKKILDLIEKGLIEVKKIQNEEIKSKIISNFSLSLSKLKLYKRSLSTLNSIPNKSELTNFFKAQTLRKISLVQATNGDLEFSLKTVELIKMGLPYYQAVALSDISPLFFQENFLDKSISILKEAEKISNTQENGYYKSAIQRDIAKAYAILKQNDISKLFYKLAILSAKTAQSNQEISRALSRIATDTNFSGFNNLTQEIIKDAINYAKNEQNRILRIYSFYEIAGSAAFSGDFGIALSLLKNIPDIPYKSSKSIRSSTQRDIAWGYAKNKQYNQAIRIIEQIKTKKEKIQAITRIVILLEDFGMEAFPRYL